jgi:hypothetical protein
MVILSEELDIANRITHILELDAPPKTNMPADKDKGAVAKCSPSTPEKSLEDLPWNALWITAADIILHMFRNKGNLSAEMFEDPKFVSESKFMEACLRFVDGNIFFYSHCF